MIVLETGNFNPTRNVSSILQNPPKALLLGGFLLKAKQKASFWPGGRFLSAKGRRKVGSPSFCRVFARVSISAEGAIDIGPTSSACSWTADAVFRERKTHVFFVQEEVLIKKKSRVLLKTFWTKVSPKISKHAPKCQTPLNWNILKYTKTWLQTFQKPSNSDKKHVWYGDENFQIPEP